MKPPKINRSNPPVVTVSFLGLVFLGLTLCNNNLDLYPKWWNKSVNLGKTKAAVVISETLMTAMVGACCTSPDVTSLLFQTY